MSTTVDAFALFEEYLREDSETDKVRFALAHPVLFSDELLRALWQRADTSPSPAALRTKQEVRRLGMKMEEFQEDPLSYPIGHGPIEAITQRLERGALAFPGALAEAVRAPVPDLLSPVYAIALGAHAQRDVQTPRRAIAVQSQQLLVAAADAMSDAAGADAIGSVARHYWIEVAKSTLAQIPDGRVLEAAEAAARWLLDRATRSGEPGQRWEAHYLYGTLFLDAYTAGKNARQYARELAIWKQRLPNEFGAAKAQSIEAAHPMPAPEEALRTAAEHLRRAAACLDGRPRGGALKALVQALAQLSEGLGVEVDQEELTAAGLEALTILDPNETGALELVATFRALGIALPERFLHPSEVRSPQPSDGPVDAAHRVLTRAQTLPDAGQALRLLRESAATFAAVDPTLRRARWLKMANLLGTVEGVPRFEGPARGGVRALVTKLEARAKHEAWPGRRFAATLVAVAARTPNVDEERAGLLLLQDVARIFPDFLREYEEVFRFLDATLWDGEASNCANSGRYLESVAAYANAAPRMMALADDDRAYKALAGIVDVLSRSQEALGEEALPHLARLAFQMEQHGGDRAVELLQAGYRAVTAAFRDAINSEMLAGLLELAKGHSLGATLRRVERYDPRADPDVRVALAEIRALEAEAADAETRGERLQDLAPLQREVVQAAYPAADAPRAGSGAMQQVYNLKHQIDRHIARELLATSALDARPSFADDETRARLDERTVLMDIYVGQRRDGMSLFTRLLTRDASRFFEFRMAGESADPLVITIGPRELRAHPMTPAVATLREAIQQVPEGGELGSSRAMEALAYLSRALLSPSLVTCLAELRAAGKDHLCVVPHGPLHFVPFHVLGADGRLLADDWIVTQLPNIRLLEPIGSVETSRREGAAVFGLGFSEPNRFDLAELPHAPEEAREIAQTLGVEPVPEAESSPSRVAAALRAKRWVHLATHGSQEVEAPAFHNVFLTPEAGSDGRLFAYELMAEPLSGLEVLTLSACESGLGRVDEGDNLRGFPAALMLGGCQAIVAALWPVDDDSAREFFVAFYGSLHGGASVRKAFREAQERLREAKPEFRDWAPFYLAHR